MHSISHSVIDTWEAETHATDSVLIRFKIFEVRGGEEKEEKGKRVEKEGRERKKMKKNLKILCRATYGIYRHINSTVEIQRKKGPVLLDKVEKSS